MPLIGTRTEVSLDNINSLDDLARLTTGKKDGTTVLYASKGTLSDGLYSVWAKCCPNQARTANQNKLNDLKEGIKNTFGQNALDIFEAKFNAPLANKNNSSLSLKISRITVEDLKKYEFVKALQKNYLANKSIPLLDKKIAKLENQRTMVITTSRPLFDKRDSGGSLSKKETETLRTAINNHKVLSEQLKTTKQALVENEIQLAKLTKLETPFSFEDTLTELGSLRPLAETFMKDIAQEAKKRGSDPMPLLEGFHRELKTLLSEKSAQGSTVSFKEFSAACASEGRFYAFKSGILPKTETKN